MPLSKVVKFFCILMLLCGSAFGQTVTGNLLGTLTDPQQAVVPGAVVQLADQATGAVRTTSTNAEGIFRFNNVPPGNYSVSIKTQGFKSYLQKDISLTASETRDLGRIALELGTLQDEITVTAQATPVQIASGEKSAVVEGEQLNQIAIKGRNLFEYLTVLPGVTGRGRGAETAKGGGVTINGGGDFNFTVDGITELDTGSNACCHYIPNLDAIGEVKVLSSNYSAEYGRNQGGTIIAVTKSGGRNFTGTAWWNKRHEKLNANSWNNNRSNTPKSKYRYDMYGFSIGGPVYIPNFFNTEKKHLFFFFSQEYTKQLPFSTLSFANVPTALERTGDFSQSYDQSGNLVTIMDPATGQPFEGNKIPANRISPIGLAMLNYWPEPNYVEPDPALKYQRNYKLSETFPYPRRNDVLRIDTYLTSKLSGYFRYANDFDEAIQASGPYRLDPTDNVWKPYKVRAPNPGHGYSAGVTYVLNQTTVNEFLFGYTWNTWSFYNVYQSQMDRSRMGNAPRWYKDSDIPVDNLFYALMVPNVNFGNPPPSAPSNSPMAPFTNYDRIWSYQDNVTMIKGKHSLKLGIYIERTGKKQIGGRPDTPYLGAYNFGTDNSWTTSLGNTGHGYANALLGNFNSYAENKKVVGDFWYYNIETYVQDSWRVLPRLTLDLGVRLYHVPPYENLNGAEAAFVPSAYQVSRAARLYYPLQIGPQSYAWDMTGDPNQLNLQPAPLVGTYVPESGDFTNGFQIGGQGALPTTIYTTPALKPSFRLGFAWDIFGNGKTALRGGFGTFYNRNSGNGAGVWDLASNPPITQARTLYYANFSDIAGGSEGGAVGVTSGTSNIGDQPLQTTYTVSFGIQRDLGFNTVLDASYVGTFGRNANVSRDINVIPMWSKYDHPTWPDNFLRTNYPGLGSLNAPDFVGLNNYNSLQLSVNRRFSNNLSFGLAWTFSKNLGIGGGGGPGGPPPGPGGPGGAGTGPSAYKELPDLDWAYGPTAADNRVVINYVYNLPKLSPHIGGSKVLAVITDDWVLSGITTFAAGSLYTPSFSAIGTEMTGSATGAKFNLVGDPYLPKSERTFYKQFNTNAFAMPTPCSATNHSLACFGNAGISILRGPGTHNWDMSVAKRFPIGLGEGRALQFRFETYNTWNHTNYSGVDSNQMFMFGNPVNQNFGAYNGAGSPRIIQFSLRFEY